MRPLLSACCALAMSLLSSVALAVAPDRWDTVIQNSAVHTIDLWRGESLDLRPRFFSYTTPWAISTGATVTLYWSTNNFASAPWGTNGTVVATETGRVSAIWTPSCDAGAATYQYFVGVSETSGLLYRARGTIRMHTSPGYQPSTAPMPVWDGWTNNYIYAPWSSVLAISNNFQSVLLSGLTANSNSVDQQMQSTSNALNSYLQAGMTADSNLSMSAIGIATSNAVAICTAALAVETNRAISFEQSILLSSGISLVSSGGLWRIEWRQYADNAAGASSDVVRIALTNEATIRAAQDIVNLGYLNSSGTLWRTEWQTAAGASAEVARITATNQAAQSVASAYLPLTGGVVATLSVTNGLWLNSFDLTKSWQIKATTNGDWLYLWTPETGRWAFPDLGPVARTVASTYDLSLITAASLGAAEVSVVATQIWDKSQYPDAVWLEDAGVYFATAEQGAKADAALTNAAQFVAMAGNVTRTGTLGGNNAVVSSDYVTLAQQQASIQSGIVGYWTTNRNTVRTNGFSKPLMVFSCTNTAALASGTINIPTTSNGEYVANLICTDKSFTSLQHGTVDVELWMNENVAGSASITAEFYAYDTVRNTLSAFEGVAVLGQAVPAGATVGKLLFSIPYGDLATTNLCYPVIRLKLTALLGTPTLVLSVENGTPSHFSMTFPTSELLAPLEARVTVVETGVAAVSNATFGAWSNATVIAGELLLDWNAGAFRSSSPTNGAYTIAATNTPATGPRVMQLLLTTPTNTTPTISWPTNVIWTSQLDVTSNRTYMISIIYDGGSYAIAPLYSRAR